MSTSVGVNVLRWSALATGVFYGFYNQLSISARERAQAKQHEYQHKESLIQQAKAEWQRKQAPAQSQSSGAKADPKDPNADLNTLLGITDEK
ncbi:hypothetical protein CC80DRAFT_490170 [Byssothecium circinans]|uniref:ATP synthase F(0) complex subunit e, mitochondrial n=1 Tax=Byssothecium circinans TaxID=147558 RepID=A0A6A5U5R4_9PLEO|nr:hypothetical protein CC80DRAFT_490170 [Byssothecium circinans]